VALRTFLPQFGVLLALMVSLKDEVIEALKTQGAPDGSRELWEEVFKGYEEGGSDTVRDLLERKVKEIRRAARAEAADMKSAAGALKSKKSLRKRR
jgi:hypothetical protein